jgi:hypothetical protein
MVIEGYTHRNITAINYIVVTTRIMNNPNMNSIYVDASPSGFSPKNNEF